ncbi:hypothetical protein EJV47_18955 [Hymenobacter gummosus]|uniref:Outer membrane protein beta-barrel domain-containing protein n=1 Tax=Hymenobacter gummosus TaxID=1776032 RepID=A0A431TZT7_9BACT|nr:hypothetical protein [Hymenobacter gummosus]RTQ47501.1 hypothetical protein EJV47_18955 [Hymenobacter gummosus]
MKHLFLSAALLLAAAGTQAQTAPGTFLLTGSLGYDSRVDETSATQSSPIKRTVKNSQLNLSPRVGVFVANRLAVGVQADLSWQKAEMPDAYYSSPSGLPQFADRTDRSKGASIGPFVRYYQMLGEKMGFYGHLAGGYTRAQGSTTYEGPASYNNGKYVTKGGFANLTPGLVYFPSNRIGLEVSLGNLSYSSNTGKQEEPALPDAPQTRTSYFGARFGLSQLLLGVSCHLGGGSSN